MGQPSVEIVIEPCADEIEFVSWQIIPFNRGYAGASDFKLR